MNWVEIIIGFLGGGGLVATLTIPYQVRKARAEAEKSVADNWKEFAEEMKAEINELKEQAKATEATSKAQYEAIMLAFGCKALAMNPNAECPVIEAFRKGEQ